MSCETVRMPGGGTAIVCGPRRRQPRCQMPGCTRPGARQCDYPVAPGKICDRYLCAEHAVPQGRNRDYCPDHPGQATFSGVVAMAERPARLYGDFAFAWMVTGITVVRARSEADAVARLQKMSRDTMINQAVKVSLVATPVGGAPVVADVKSDG